jgi:hypothetical protein
VEGNQLCDNCKPLVSSQSNQVEKPSNKRDSSAVVSPGNEQNVNKRVCTKETNELSFDIELLADMTKDQLLKQARIFATQARNFQKLYNDAKQALEAEKQKLQQYKIAFAEKAFAALTSTARPQAGSYAAVVRGGRDENIPARSTLVVTIDQTDRDQPIDAKLMDNLLDSKNKGPVAQQVSRKDDKVYVTFADAVESARAQTIMESKAECKAIFKPIGTQVRMYPAIGLYADISDVRELENDIRFRNPCARDTLQKVIVTKRLKNGAGIETGLGHIKLLFNSAAARDRILNQNRMFTEGKAIRVVEVDANREVRRCYKCQKYGHTQQHCSDTVRCGHCAGQHSTGECRSGSKRCINCHGEHASGDRTCPEQVKEVRKYRLRFLE